MTIRRKREPRDWSWPHGERVAVSVGLALEDFEYRSQVSHSQRPGERDGYSLSYADYGWRTGIWRLLDLLDEFEIKANVSTSGLSAERHPDVVRAVAEAGHELNGHGWTNDVLPDQGDPDAVREDIRRCAAALAGAAGAPPVGWTGPGSAGAESTLEILVEEGFVWNGDEAADDIPYVRTTPAGNIVILPRTNSFHNDLIMCIIPNNPPQVLWEAFKDTFDELYAEGNGGCPKWTEITLHAHMAGRPTLIPTVRKCLDYARSHDGVWIAPRRDIARWTVERENTELTPTQLSGLAAATI